MGKCAAILAFAVASAAFGAALVAVAGTGYSTMISSGVHVTIGTPEMHDFIMYILMPSLFRTLALLQ
jgi:hypothetical protein